MSEGIPQTAEQETIGTREDKEARAAQEAAGVEQTGVSGRVARARSTPTPTSPIPCAMRATAACPGSRARPGWSSSA
ncbi:hypothetical protein KEF29_02835 [Streptomyces tuirus]|uniref:Uncharacterized protein n=1 Tax=Streptomyces tuirus TaxID=68278 RepID=A0A941F7V5_9ACTN|nr:hypothetical protein [Streptomyces tuirus]